MKRDLIVKDLPKSPISEVFRTLRTNIQFMNNRKKLQSLLITSTVAGEGKSWISANLAVTFAQAGKKVILLDADMRKGCQYTIFGISPKPGLSNYLSGLTDDDKVLKLQDYIQETEVKGLYVIAAGNIPPNPAELLVSETMINLMDNLKEMCDIVIVDGPPTQLVTDSLILTRIVDNTVVVAASNITKKESLNKVIENIQNVGGKIAGVVLNKVPVSSKSYESSFYSSPTDKFKKFKNKHTKKSKQQAINKSKSEKIENKNRERLGNLGNEIIKEVKPHSPQFENPIEETSTEEVVSKNEQQQTEQTKTEDIINQINEYIENEKKNLQ